MKFFEVVIAALMIAIVSLLAFIAVEMVEMKDDIWSIKLACALMEPNVSTISEYIPDIGGYTGNINDIMVYDYK